MKQENFISVLSELSWDKVANQVYSKTRAEVERALKRSEKTWDDFIALISPAAKDLLRDMVLESRKKTRQRFGRVMQLYAPLYVSNECTNVCTYCGFSFNNKIPRITLSEGELLSEAKLLKDFGFQHILLVSGEAATKVGVEYFKECLSLLRPLFSQLSMEVQPLETQDYRSLIDFGLSSVLVYQETYNKDSYRKYHPKGKKSNFEYRVLTPDRLGQAEIHRMGLGCLLGLADWRVDMCYLAAHVAYLRKKYWKTKFSVSFPRIRSAEGIEVPKDHEIQDVELLQLICALRLFDENLELSLSTREPAALRDILVDVGVTSMSAGSSTEPGGYTNKDSALKQFEIEDRRTAAKVKEMLLAKGLIPVWKDWDASFGVS